MTKITADWLRSPASSAVMSMLETAGHQAWFVGGCVRNALLGRAVDDLDISTDARPEVVMQLAKDADLRAIPTGIDHGTITVISEGTPYEITTFRHDVETDGRHATVAFSTSMTEDAQRRDFTMNALYAGADGVVRDPVGGLPDLQAGIVRFIGEAEDRIAEDYLRILRFFRFSAHYGNPEEGIDAEGLAACAGGLDGLEAVSRERIGTETRKLLSAPDPGPALAAMRSAGVLMRILPGAGTGLIPVLVHVEQEAGLAPDWRRRLAALGGEDLGEALRLSRADEAAVVRIMEGMGAMTSPGELGYRLGLDEAVSVLALRHAVSERLIPEQDIAAARTGAGATCPVSASDLMPGLEGKALGNALREIESRWIASGFALSKAQLLP